MMQGFVKYRSINARVPNCLEIKEHIYLIYIKLLDNDTLFHMEESTTLIQIQPGYINIFDFELSV